MNPWLLILEKEGLMAYKQKGSDFPRINYFNKHNMTEWSFIFPTVYPRLIFLY